MINIIFDIDDTLIKFNYLSNYIYDNNYLNVSTNTHFTTGILDNRQYILLIRNFTIFLLQFCIHHFNVGIWSTGTEPYIKQILNDILPKSYIDKLNVIIVRKNTNNSVSTFKDIKNNKIIKISNYNNQIVKNLDFLFNDPFYKKIFNQKNTLLIDDNLIHIANNPLNSIHIPKYCEKSNDDILFKLYLWLDKHKKSKNIQKTEKINFYNYKKKTINKCSTIGYKTKKVKKLNFGDMVKVQSNKNSFWFGYVTKVNKNNNYDIVLYDFFEKLDNDPKYIKIRKNININKITKYVP